MICIHPVLFDALKARHALNPRSRIFKTPNKKLFIAFSQIAHKQAMQGYPCLSFTNDQTNEKAIFPFTAAVLTMSDKQSKELRSAFLQIWKKVNDPQDFCQSVPCQAQSPHSCVPVDVAGLSQKQSKMIGTLLAELNHDLKEIIGKHQPITSDFYGNATLETRDHIPTHAYPVLNMTIGQSGTVITDEDDDDYAEQVPECAKLFMPSRTHHRPPKEMLGEVEPQKPRFSLIANGCAYG